MLRFHFNSCPQCQCLLQSTHTDQVLSSQCSHLSPYLQKQKEEQEQAAHTCLLRLARHANDLSGGDLVADLSTLYDLLLSSLSVSNVIYWAAKRKVNKQNLKLCLRTVPL